MSKDSKKPPNDWPPVPRDIPPRIFRPLAELEARRLDAGTMERMDQRPLAHRERQSLCARRGLRRRRLAHPQKPGHRRAHPLIRLQSAVRRRLPKHQKRQMAQSYRSQRSPKNALDLLRTKQPCEEPSGLRPVLRASRHRAERLGRKILPQSNRRSHGEPPLVRQHKSENARFGNPSESPSARLGITPRFSSRVDRFTSSK
jgi:hypothetical protein